VDLHGVMSGGPGSFRWTRASRRTFNKDGLCGRRHSLTRRTGDYPHHHNPRQPVPAYHHCTYLTYQDQTVWDHLPSLRTRTGGYGQPPAMPTTSMEQVGRGPSGGADRPSSIHRGLEEDYFPLTYLLTGWSQAGIPQTCSAYQGPPWGRGGPHRGRNTHLPPPGSGRLCGTPNVPAITTTTTMPHLLGPPFNALLGHHSGPPGHLPGHLFPGGPPLPTVTKVLAPLGPPDRWDPLADGTATTPRFLHTFGGLPLHPPQKHLPTCRCRAWDWEGYLPGYHLPPPDHPTAGPSQARLAAYSAGVETKHSLLGTILNQGLRTWGRLQDPKDYWNHRRTSLGPSTTALPATGHPYNSGQLGGMDRVGPPSGEGCHLTTGPLPRNHRILPPLLLVMWRTFIPGHQVLTPTQI